MPFIWITDPHLDRADETATASFLERIAAAGSDPVVITGDISNATRCVSDLERIGDAADGTVYYVLGNHDHYGGSVGAVRDAVVELAERRTGIQWLPPAGVIELPDGSHLVGVDGWADGRHGDPYETPLALNDDRLIAEIAEQEDRSGKLAVKRVLADADARRLATLLLRAIGAGAKRIEVATHVPPFVAALPVGSRAAHPHWHPLLVSGATGTVLRRLAQRHPEVAFRVSAGHSHRGCAVEILDNLTVRVGEARYGRPTLQTP